MSCNMKHCRFDAEQEYTVSMWKDDPGDIRPRPVCRWHYWIDQLIRQYGWVLPMPGLALYVAYLVLLGYPPFGNEAWMGFVVAGGLLFLMFMLSAIILMIPVLVFEMLYLRESRFTQGAKPGK